MNLSNNELDQLFKDFQEEKPEASYQETQKAFLAATVIAAGGVLATKGILKLFTFKQWIIMISIVSTATLGTLLVSMSAAPSAPEKETEAAISNPKEIRIEPTEEEAPKEKMESFVATLESLSPELKTVIKTEGRAPIQVKAYLKADGTYHFTYIITSETSKEDLAKLQKEAEAAGFEMVCTPEFKDDRLQHLSIHIIQKEKNGQQTNILISDIDLEEKSEYKIAWNIDEEGIATTIACGEDYKSEEIDELLAELDLDNMTSEIIQLYDVYKNELLNPESDLEDLLEYQEEIELASSILENEEVRASLLEVESFELDDLEDMMEGLAEAQQELEELKLELGELAKDHEESSQKMLDALHKDGLVKDRKKRVNVSANRGKLEVNGKKIPDNLKSKYVKLIQECFDVDATDHGTQWTWSYRES